jgi:hypothetical protein
MNLEYATILLDEIILTTSNKEPNFNKMIKIRNIIGEIYND